MQKLLDFQNKNQPEVGHTHMESSEMKSLIPINPKTLLVRFHGTWGSGTPASPFGVTFGPENENLCGHHIL